VALNSSSTCHQQHLPSGAPASSGTSQQRHPSSGTHSIGISPQPAVP